MTYHNDSQTADSTEVNAGIIKVNDTNSDTFDYEESSGENSEESFQQKEDQEQESRFKDGEIITLVRVRFPGNSKSFPFLVGKKKFQYGQKVMAMSDRGMTVGYINSFPYQVPFNKAMLPIRTIARVASAEDIRQQIEFHESEKKAEIICLRLIEKYNLDMILTHVEFIQFGKKAVFYFNAPERVDFRDLVKELVQDLKMRIELRQISVRDRAAALGSVGACGLQTCCSSFLKNYGNVSIKMAKNQNLALIPSKLNGVCGQIKCCIKYEDEVYSDKRKNLPKEGTIVSVKNGDIGKVLRLHLLVEQFELLTDQGIKRKYASNQFDESSIELPVNYKFPEVFDNIIDETKSVIGLTVEEESIAEKFKNLMGQSDLTEEEDEEFDDEDDSDVDFADEINESENTSEDEIVIHSKFKDQNTLDESEKINPKERLGTVENQSDENRNERRSHHNQPQQNRHQNRNNHHRNNDHRNNEQRRPNRSNDPRRNDQNRNDQKRDFRNPNGDQNQGPNNNQRPRPNHQHKQNDQQNRPQGQGNRPVQNLDHQRSRNPHHNQTNLNNPKPNKDN